MTTRYTDMLREGAGINLRSVAAYRDGWATAEAREPRSNPWRGDAATAVERVLAKMWTRGYLAYLDSIGLGQISRPRRA